MRQQMPGSRRERGMSTGISRVCQHGVCPAYYLRSMRLQPCFAVNPDPKVRL